MTNKKADCVYAVFLDFARKLILMFENRAGGAWTFPGGEVFPDESEEEAVQRFAMDALPADANIIVVEPLGPLNQFDDGKTAKAYFCHLDGDPAVRDGHKDFSQCALFNVDDLLTAVAPHGAIIERMAWDGLSVMEESVKGPRRIEFEVEGYFCDPGASHVLVQEIDDERRQWPRLSPRDGRPQATS